MRISKIEWTKAVATILLFTVFGLVAPIALADPGDDGVIIIPPRPAPTNPTDPIEFSELPTPEHLLQNLVDFLGSLLIQ